MNISNFSIGSGKIGKIFLSLSMFYFALSQNFVLSQTQPVNPLEVEVKNDPLIPDRPSKRELTSLEKYRIGQTILELDRTAKAELEQGNTEVAFELWYRQLRLSRVLDPVKEIESLGKIGAIAWQENRGRDVRNIAERLIMIQEGTAEKSLSYELLERLATAYQQVRYLDKATEIYQQLLRNSRRKDDLAAIEEDLVALGKLYLARFDYRQAAAIYQELLALSDRQSEKQTIYLNTLVNIYDRTAQTERAIAVRQRLIQQYDDTQLNKIADLEIAIARDYQTSNQTERAIAAYNRAFKTASQTKRLATASDALSELGKLYRESERIDEAIASYIKLLQVQQQSLNYYGLINTYDTIGKLYLKSGQPTKARQSFQQGLELAKSLNYRVEYFNNQIQQSNW
ncbi:tetratricopeptide repeat protein [Pleurocapsales cyanobacterium LEGE 10410]|nr:tetratricopeptide repeat protein [Pleurocapsales cyanobacterium LEGE 10410]